MCNARGPNGRYFTLKVYILVVGGLVLRHRTSHQSEIELACSEDGLKWCLYLHFKDG